MPHNPKHIAYLKQLNPWAIARLLPNCQRTIVGRFRSRSDADGHLQCLRQLIPYASFVVVFDPLPDMEPVTASAERTEEVIV
ncbi:hypothetical protein [Allocoleopsis sp.]|uniref:hypothetical protein n=1 Tax=Allocoleopsis sp. TaxID=3088169 RepID=UPI002FD400A7